MPTFRISDREWAALLDEPGDVLKAYCEIRRHMNYGTGIAGLKNHPGGKLMNERAFSELLEIPSAPGRAHSPATRKRVRHVLGRLEKINLLERIGPLVFRLPLADRDHSDSERWGQTQGQKSPEVGPPGGDLESTDCAGSGSRPPAGGGAIDSPEVGPEVGPTTGVPGINSISNEIESSPAGRLPPCPHDQILALWAEHLSSCRQPLRSRWTSNRAAYKHLAARWRENFKIRHSKAPHDFLYRDIESGLVWWGNFFRWIEESWLTRGDFKGLSLDWVVKPENYNKIIEGAYRE